MIPGRIVILGLSLRTSRWCISPTLILTIAECRESADAPLLYPLWRLHVLAGPIRLMTLVSAIPEVRHFTRFPLVPSAVRQTHCPKPTHSIFIKAIWNI